MDSSQKIAIEQDIKRHIVIYAFLLVSTVVNFIVSKQHVFGERTVVAVLGIAILQGSLVACFFMHLISEKKVIYLFLVMIVIFFIALFFLPILSFFGKIYGSVHVS